ncbi:DUF4271 domain-containing protein [Pedobacter frigiditerrae]|uniref:DUF4271 domain-containing protein n=1 Tax=Pedobacter frigiditerrae TaxID=2530452 RepID=A0A4R0N0N1_9SPHI|nr:DUF4271 domain-containing protein [Pedobacter frigiditerrae]TCC93288.1 DUF4271 domain-containing protein [Pedobacter frigiditerrae]
MYKRIILLVFFILGGFVLLLNANQTQLESDTLQQNALYTDSLDSVVVAPIDTITPQNLRPLDSLTKAQIADSLRMGFGFEKGDFKTLIENFLLSTISNDPRQKGEVLPRGEIWVLGFVSLLLVMFAVLKNTFSKQLIAIVESFFSNRALSNLNKEDNLFNSWPFLLLFVQFGFTIGMFFYLVAQYQGLEYAKNGFQFFITVSALIIVLYVLKIVLLRLLGFIFDIQKPIGEYVSILYLSYFNTSLLFIPLVVAFALSPLKSGRLYIAIAIILIIVIFIFQFIRAGINILSNYRFPKVYLILYFCTLEICPILILIKAIGF